MASLVAATRTRPKPYLDRAQFATLELQELAKRSSSTVYVGNLSLVADELSVRALFQRCGPVRRVVMGLHRIERTPCGFCFVEFKSHASAVEAERLLDGVWLDRSAIKVEVDPGFKEGRQFGRARSGGQVRNEPRQTMAFGVPQLPPTARPDAAAAPMGRPGGGARRGGRGRGGDEGAGRGDEGAGRADRDRDQNQDQAQDRPRGPDNGTVEPQVAGAKRGRDEADEEEEDDEVRERRLRRQRRLSRRERGSDSDAS
jgi:nuclear cap-binding protein subunit 2